jgi:hypothetical protein
VDVNRSQIGRAVEAGFEGARQVALLGHIVASPGGSVREYAAKMGVTKPVISRGCSTLVALGYVKREVDESDYRLAPVRPTERGRRLSAYIFGPEILSNGATKPPTRPNRPRGHRGIGGRGLGRA